LGPKLKPIVASEGFITFIYYFTRFYCATFRLRIENEKTWLDHLEQGGSVLLCTWHQQFFAAIRHFQKYRQYSPALMISQSSDGAIVAGVAQRTGWRTVRGSSSRGGRAALKRMIKHLKASKLAGHIVDGPRGPAGVVKSGVIRMAHVNRSAIVPFYVIADRCWIFNSWDRFLLPKPFARVTLRFEDPIHFDWKVDSEGFETQRQHLEAIMRPGLIE
jgi:lysophospholipid acyltransferase (LPLAT)-like uncharacterized protein